MDEIDFSILFNRHGGYSLPVLIELSHPEQPTWYFTSNDKDIQIDNYLYKSVPMSYKFPSSKNGVPQGGTLEIDIDIHKEDGYELLRWFDDIDHRATIDVVGLINEQGTVTPISQITQSHGSVSWDGQKISWTPGPDDRMNMQVNPWVADNDFLMG
jgi:hypothetical protein